MAMRMPARLAKLGLAKQMLILCGGVGALVFVLFVVAADHFLREVAREAAIVDARNQMTLESRFMDRAYQLAAGRALRGARRFVAGLPKPIVVSGAKAGSLPSVSAGDVRLSGNLNLLEEFRDRNDGAEPAILVNSAGRVWRSSTLLRRPDGASLQGSQIPDADPSAEAMRSGSESTYVVERSGVYYAISIIPLVKNAQGGTLVGATTRIDLSTDIAAMRSWLAETRIGRSGYVFAIAEGIRGGRTETVLALHPTLDGPSLSPVAKVDPELHAFLPKAVAAATVGAVSQTELGSGEAIVFSIRSPQWRWTLVGVAKSSEMFESAYHDRRLLAAASLAALAGLGLAVILGMSAGMKRLGDIGEALRTIGQGDFSARALVGEKDSKNELDALACEINTTAQSLGSMSARLEVARQQLVQGEKMASIGQLAAGVAHEINNPIGFVASNIETLGGYVASLMEIASTAKRLRDAGGLDPEGPLGKAIEKADLDWLESDVPPLMGETREGIERVKRIVSDLKDFSRKDSGDNLAERVDLVTHVRSAAAVARSEIKFHADIVDHLPASLEAECFPSPLGQVFLNLLVNAAHAIEARGGTRGSIELSGGRSGNEVWLEFKDDGCGMDKKTASKIFDPFFTTKAVGKGTSLGLSIVHGIIKDRHGGDIEVDSEPGRGTTFRIRLPSSRDGAIVGTPHTAENGEKSDG